MEASSASIAADSAPATSEPQPFVRKSRQEKKAEKYALKRELISKKRKRTREKHAERWKAMDESERDRIREQWKTERVDSVARLRENMSTGLRICIDLSFDETNSDRERRSCAKQMCYVYKCMRTSPTPLSIHLTSYHGPIAETMRRQGTESWPITLHESSVWESFAKEQLVYLSPDAQDSLPLVDPAKVYVIGGIVDRSVRKGLSLSVAEERGVACFRLPVQEHIPQRVTHVLNIDTVVQIIARFVETGDWRSTLMELVPLRMQQKKEGGSGKRGKRAKVGGGEEEDTVSVG